MGVGAGGAQCTPDATPLGGRGELCDIDGSHDVSSLIWERGSDFEEKIVSSI